MELFFNYLLLNLDSDPAPPSTFDGGVVNTPRAGDGLGLGVPGKQRNSQGRRHRLNLKASLHLFNLSRFQSASPYLTNSTDQRKIIFPLE